MRVQHGDLASTLPELAFARRTDGAGFRKRFGIIDGVEFMHSCKAPGAIEAVKSIIAQATAPAGYLLYALFEQH